MIHKDYALPSALRQGGGITPLIIVYEDIQDSTPSSRLLRGGVLEADIFPTITTRTGDAQIDIILEYEEEGYIRTIEKPRQERQGG